jgi:hypothetical protein
VDFRRFYDGTHRRGIGWAKITNSCEQAVRGNLGYVWVDTCCIDKTSSAELQESINSMFNYYRDAAVCYAFLVDVTDEQYAEQFGQSRWFKRGWTLQELIAPREVTFFANIRRSVAALGRPDIGWKYIGRRGQNSSANAPVIAPDVLGFQISTITRIEFEFLVGIYPLSKASVATRMAWAAGRQTTRKEDRAYSLLGIFNINMPLLYGEGYKAFERLQKEIMAVSDDETILAWHYGLDFGKCAHDGAFAQSPDCYKGCIDLVQIPSPVARRKHYTLTNRGLRMKGVVELGSRRYSYVLGLNCTTRGKVEPFIDINSSAGPGAVAIDVVGIEVGSDLCIWRPSTSVPFAANSDVFATRLHLMWLKVKSRLTDGPNINASLLVNEGCSFYIDTLDPTPNRWEFVMFIQPSVLASLNDANIKLIKIDPYSAIRIIYQLNEEEWDRQMLNQPIFSDYGTTLSTLIYQREGSAEWYATSMNINLDTTRIRRSAERDYINGAASRIRETVLEEPDVTTTTHQLPPGLTRDELHKITWPIDGKEISTGVHFHIKVLTYKERLIYALGCSIG